MLQADQGPFFLSGIVVLNSSVGEDESLEGANLYYAQFRRRMFAGSGMQPGRAVPSEEFSVACTAGAGRIASF